MNRGPRRVAWIALASVVAVTTLVIGTFSVVNLLAREQETITTVFDDPDVRLIDIELDNGSVTLVGSTDAAITVTTELTHGLRQAEQDVAVDGDRLVIRESCQGPPFATFCHAEYVLRVPTGVGTTIRSGNGSILVTGIDGPVDASSSNGSVAVSRTSGDVRLRSSNGRVEATAVASAMVEASSRNGRVSLAFAEPPEQVEVDSSNGAVEVVLPETGDAYRVDASSSNGEVDTPVRTDPTSSRTIVAESGNGSVTVRYPDG